MTTFGKNIQVSDYTDTCFLFLYGIPTKEMNYFTEVIPQVQEFDTRGSHTGQIFRIEGLSFFFFPVASRPPYTLMRFQLPPKTLVCAPGSK